MPNLETLTTATNLGDSDDWTKGGNGDNILIGGAGSDFAFGGRSRDLLIGGDGSDMFSGLGGEDIPIASATIHDGDRDALDSIMAEWVRTDQSYA